MKFKKKKCRNTKYTIYFGNNISSFFLGMRKLLIFAQRTDIRKISLDVDYFTDVSLPIRSLRNAIALGVDPVKG